jgi:hypothetical protein
MPKAKAISEKKPCTMGAKSYRGEIIVVRNNSGAKSYRGGIIGTPPYPVAILW